MIISTCNSEGFYMQLVIYTQQPMYLNHDLWYITLESLLFSCFLRSDLCVEFVKVAGEHEVRGQIKLKFRDVTGSPIVVTRTLVSQQKVHENKRQPNWLFFIMYWYFNWSWNPAIKHIGTFCWSFSSLILIWTTSSYLYIVLWARLRLSASSKYTVNKDVQNN